MQQVRREWDALAGTGNQLRCGRSRQLALPPATNGTHIVATEVIPHGQAFCLIGNQPIRKQDRLAGATCPFCPVQLPPKNRQLLVTIDDEDNVISFELSPTQPLWKQPLFVVLVVLLGLMIVAAIVGQS